MFEPHRPTIGVSLSGGAAYGIAHVGVLTYFAEHRIPVDRLAGVSAGAVVAALYATARHSRRCERKRSRSLGTAYRRYSHHALA
jgi:NTE family protein